MNVSDPTRYNAYRFPTEAEIRRGREETDMFFVGASATLEGAFDFLERGEAGAWNGQVQLGHDGPVYNSR